MELNRSYEEKLLAEGVQLTPRYVEVPSGCWLCGSKSEKLTREHVFPQWLLKYFDCGSHLHTVEHWSPTGQLLDRRGPIPLKGLVFGKICGPCNGGWMSRLESAVAHQVWNQGWFGLARNDPAQFSKWCVKTATVINLSQQRRIQIPDGARRPLCGEQTDIDDRWSVYLSRTESKPESPLGWFQGAMPNVACDDYDEVVECILRETYACSMKLGEIVATVFFKPDPTIQLDPAGDLSPVRALPHAVEGLLTQEFQLPLFHHCAVAAGDFAKYSDHLDLVKRGHREAID